MGDFTEIELPFEASGRIPDASRPRSASTTPTPTPSPTPSGTRATTSTWPSARATRVVTPLQLVNAYATLANGGTVYAPHVGGAVLDVTGAELRKIEPRVNRKTTIPAAIREPRDRRLPGGGRRHPGHRRARLRRLPASTASRSRARRARPRSRASRTPPCSPPSAPPTTPGTRSRVVLEESGFGAAAAAPVARRIFDHVPGPAAHARRLHRSAGTRWPSSTSAALAAAPAQPRAPWRHVDLLLLAAIAGITAIGLLMIYSSTRQGQSAAGLDPGYFLKRQALFVVIGLVVHGSAWPSSTTRSSATSPPPSTPRPCSSCSSCSRRSGTERRGTQAWFQVGPVPVRAVGDRQAGAGDRPGRLLRRPSGRARPGRLATALGIAGRARCCSSTSSPTSGTGMVFVAILMGILLVGGASPRQIAILTLLGITAIVIVLELGVLKDYQRDRLSAFLDPQEDVQRSAYNLQPVPDRHRRRGRGRAGPVPGHPDQPVVRARAAHRLHLHRRGRGARASSGRPPCWGCSRW